MKRINEEIWLFAKIILVIFIVISVFYDYGKHLTFLQNTLVKLLFIIVIAVVIVFDLHTGMILLIAFMMLMIQFNSVVINNIQAKKLEFFTAFPKNTCVSNIDKVNDERKNKVSNDILNYNIETNNNIDYVVDPKVKPYEVYVKMMTTQENLEQASNAAFL